MKYIVAFFLVVANLGLKAQSDSIVPSSEEEHVPGRANLVDDDPIFTIVQQMPQFPGGEKAMYAFIAQTIQYPDEAKDQGIQGTVYVQFIVNKDGCIDTSAVQILRGVHPSLDNEAIRVVKEMPCWTPGTQREKPVRVYHKQPFRFTMKD